MTLALLYGLAALAAVLLLAATTSAATRLALARSTRRRAGAAADLRPAVAAIIARHGDGRAGDRLIELAARLPRARRQALTEVALDYLSKIRGRARRPLLDLLAYEGVVPRASRDVHRRSWVRRARAASVLGRAGHPSAATDLAALLTDPVAEVRAVAATGLPVVLAGARASGWIVPELLRTVGRGRPVPPALVVEALLRLGPDTVPALRTALHTGPVPVREIAAEALGRLGVPEAAPALAATALDPGGAVAVRATAASALGRLRAAPSVIDPLTAALEPAQPPPVRRAAALALADLGDPAAVGPLARLLDGGHPLAGVAAAALARLGAPGLVALAAVRQRRPGAPAGRYAATELAIQEVRAGRTCPDPPERWTVPAASQPAASQPAGSQPADGQLTGGQLTGAGR
jgi:HEAT repeat protein